MSNNPSFFDNIKQKSAIQKWFHCYDCGGETPQDKMQRHILKRRDGTDGDMLTLCPACKEGRNTSGSATQGDGSTSRSK